MLCVLCCVPLRQPVRLPAGIAICPPASHTPQLTPPLPPACLPRPPVLPADGMRYGTLCIVDLKRRSFSAEMYALLCNFANLVVQGGCGWVGGWACVGGWGACQTAMCQPGLLQRLLLID